MGTIRVTQEAFKHMAKESGGSGGVLIHTASISGGRKLFYWCGRTWNLKIFTEMAVRKYK